MDDVTLSRAEVQRIIRLLTKPSQITCGKCHGEGERAVNTWHGLLGLMPMIKECPKCEGTGLASEARHALEALRKALDEESTE